jgi:hypothetical protein
MVKVTCGKCNGIGRIDVYSHVLGGVCFSCDGRGHREVKRVSKPSVRYLVSAVERDTGKRITPFALRARSEAQALRIARTTLAGGTGYFPESAEVTVAK